MDTAEVDGVLVGDTVSIGSFGIHAEFGSSWSDDVRLKPAAIPATTIIRQMPAAMMRKIVCFVYLNLTFSVEENRILRLD